MANNLFKDNSTSLSLETENKEKENKEDINQEETSELEAEEVKEFTFCPYCGEKLLNENNKITCVKCNEEFGFLSDSKEYSNDEFEYMLIERKGKRYGIYMLVPATISTFFSLLCISLMLLFSSGSVQGTAGILTSQIIGTTFFGYLGVFGCLVISIIAWIFNSKAIKLGFKRIGIVNVSFWISILGLAYGLTTVMVLLIKALGA